MSTNNLSVHIAEELAVAREDYDAACRDGLPWNEKKMLHQRVLELEKEALGKAPVASALEQSAMNQYYSLPVTERRSNRSVKKVAVTELVKHINGQLSMTDISQETKKVLCDTLHEILHSTNNYQGFNYIKWTKGGGFEQWVKDGEPSDNKPYLGNEYDRFYYFYE